MVMAMTTAAAADSTTSSHSPRSPSDTKTRWTGFPSPWAQVVRGAVDSTDSSATPQPILPEKVECSPSPENFPLEKGNCGNVGKKPAWIKRSNGVSGDQTSCGSNSVVMGAESWPALSESTRPSQKSSSSSSDSPKSASEGSLTSHSQSKQGSANANNNYSTNNVAPARQRSMKRGGGGGGGGGGGNRQGGFIRGPPPPLPLCPVFPVPEIAQNSFGGVVQMAGPDSSLRQTRLTGGFSSHPYPANEHPNQRSSHRRGNFGQHGRGDGRNNYHGVRRDQDHGNHEWSTSHGPHARDAHGHPQRPPPSRNFVRPPVQGAAPFTPPVPVRPYGSALVYPDVPLFCYLPTLQGMPYFACPPVPHPYALQDPLTVSIVKQIDYYFSDANLVKDQFLRSNMDDQGWVPISLIANFPRVKNLTDSIPFILDCLRVSTVVEVQGDKIRRQNDWMKWIPPNRSPSQSAMHSPTARTPDNLATSFQKVSLDELNQDNLADKAHLGSTIVPDQSFELAGELQVTNIEGPVQGVC